MLYMCFALLAVVVAMGTIWMFILPARTMNRQLICGVEEHTHTEACYERQLICGQEESDTHVHTEECWTSMLTCSKPEHQHRSECYSAAEAKQPEADGSTEQTSPEASDKAPDMEGVPAEGTQTPDADAAPDSSAPEQPPAAPLPEGTASSGDPAVLEQFRKEIPSDYTELRTASLSEGGTVYLFSQPGVISDSVQLSAAVLDETDPAFAPAEQRVKDSGLDYAYLKALDLSLRDENGVEIEPSAPIYVSIDMNGLLPEEVDLNSVQVQHHKELPQSDEGEQSSDASIVLESVLDETKGARTAVDTVDTQVVTFPVDSFSIYTITSKGWQNLKIRIQCVDEFGEELRVEHKPQDIVLGSNYTSGANFTKMFSTNDHDRIEGYVYDGKAYLMRNGNYDVQIYGIRRENNRWYYHPNDNDKDRKAEFSTQPNFESIDGGDPPDYIRVVYRKSTTIHVQYMDDAGSFEKEERPLSAADAPGGTNPDNINYVGTILDIGNVDAMPKSSTYFYVGKAYVGAPDRSNEVVEVIRQDGHPYGITPEGKKLLISETSPLKLLYHKIQSGTPDTIETVPTSDKGMKIHLFDYNPSINDGHNLQFRPQGSGSLPFNNWTGKDGGIYTKIVDSELGKDGYPVVNGESLAYLFDPEQCRKELRDDGSGKVKQVHSNLDHLFLLNKDGYYYYDSMTSFATVNPEGINNASPDTDGRNFTVYRQPVLPGYTGTGDNAKFLPFDSYANADRLKPHNQSANKEYHFGMVMETPFVMPPGGVVPDADGAHTGFNDMIFEFNGDDDVWLFIDGKLVLDLGGIHDRYGGTVNFRTGEVITNAPHTPHGGKRQANLYGIEGDPNALTDEQLKKAREDAGFGKITQHTFKFFYLERGEGASNCEIRFNLVPVEHGLIIGKRITDTMQDAPTEHMWYQFEVETEQNGERIPLQNATFRRILWTPDADPVIGGQNIGVGHTDENGRFWLRAGERADFSGAIDLRRAGINEPNQIKIFVSEIFSDGQAIPQVSAWGGKETAAGTHMVVTDPSGHSRKLTPPLYDSEGVLFHNGKTAKTVSRTTVNGEIKCEVAVSTGRDNQFNWIDFENDFGEVSGLNITKHARRTNGDEINDVPYAIKIELWDVLEKEWVPLSVGSEYWILNPGETTADVPKQHLGETSDGLIHINNRQTIHLHLVPGTQYRVTESLSLEDEAVYKTTYEGRSSVSSDILDLVTDEQGHPAIQNRTPISAGGQHYITITNEGDPIVPPAGSFVLAKQVGGIVPNDSKFRFHLLIQDYETDDTTGGYQPELNCTATYYGFPDGAHAGNPAHGVSEPLVFRPSEVSGGTGGTPMFGAYYEVELELYPGELVVITGLPDGKSIGVEELFTEEQEGDYEVSFREDGKSPVVGTELTATDPIGADHVVKVLCMNESNLKETSGLQLSKRVERTDQPNGNLLPEDLSTPFRFQITLQNPSSFAPELVEANKMTVDGMITYFPLEFKPNGTDYVAEVTLLHGEMLTLTKLPVEEQVLIQELDHDGYAVFMNDVPVDHTTVKLTHTTGAPHYVLCRNVHGLTLPETGGHGTAVYFAAGAFLVVTASVMLCLLRHRRKAKP